MTWFLAFLLAVIAFAAAALLFKAPRSGWEAIGAALLLGIAGYGMQANPDLSGAPKPAAQQLADDPAALVDARNGIDDADGLPSNRWIVIADGFARNGQFANASAVLLGAVRENPDDGEAWLSMGNALVAHADGLLTPASLNAFQHAADADPEHPGPPFFLGMALAQTGRYGEAKSLWTELLERSPEDAPWRADLENRLATLEQYISQQGASAQGR